MVKQFDFYIIYRINQELHSWVQDHNRKQENADNYKPMTISDYNSISISTNADTSTITDSTRHQQQQQPQHISRKVALHNQRSSKFVNDLRKRKNNINYDIHFFSLEHNQ